MNGDPVNHPPHYGGDTVYEAIKVIEAWELGFCLGNVPTTWGKNQKGMQADEEVGEPLASSANTVWLDARDRVVYQAQKLLSIGIHKQFTNRLLEPFMWHTVIVSATEWDNFFHLRCHPDAHPDIRIVAEKMREVMQSSEPWELSYGEWHCPLIQDDEEDAWCDQDPAALPTSEKLKVSVGRCARVSYLTHEGKRDLEADVELADRLLASGHMSPFEHVARPMTRTDRMNNDSLFCGNFRGWVQYRKTIPNEHDMLATSTVEGGT